MALVSDVIAPHKRKAYEQSGLTDVALPDKYPPNWTDDNACIEGYRKPALRFSPRLSASPFFNHYRPPKRGISAGIFSHGVPIMPLIS